MTLVQASIANKGESIVLIADRLWTRSMGRDFPPYEFEGKQKIKHFEKVCVGFAGSIEYMDVSISKIMDRFKSGDYDLDEIVKIISEYINEKKKLILEGNIKLQTNLSTEEFFKLSQEARIPQELINKVYANLQEMRPEFECIVAGFDKNDHARIIEIDRDGDFREATNFGVCSIGSGWCFSQIYFDLKRYNENEITENEGLIFALEAKKWAEAPTGVGEDTDIILIRKDGTFVEIWEDDNLMKQLYDIHEKIISEEKKQKSHLINSLIDSSGGRLVGGHSNAK